MFKPEATFRLGVFDINGTIHTDTDGVSSTVEAGFENLRGKSIQSTIITGRGTHRAKELLGGSWNSIVSEGAPTSVENGARLVAPDGSNIRFYQLDKAIVDAAIDAIESAEDGVSYMSYIPRAPGAKSILWLPKDGSSQEHSALNGTQAEIVGGSLARVAARMACEQACMLRIGSVSPEVTDSLAGANFFLNQAELNLLPDGVDKATGVLDIADYMDVPLSEILIAGNDHNDLSMLGLPVAERLFVASGPLADAGLEGPTVSLTSPIQLGEYLCRV